MSKVLFEEKVPGIGIITLNDPQTLNAMGQDMADGFAAVVATIRAKFSQLRAIVITGAGKAFSAGGDLKMLDSKRSLSGEENRLIMHRFYQSFLGVRELDIPLIAAINGPAVGAGLCVASACDVRIASDDAKLGFTFVRLGLHPGMGASYFLPRVLASGQAAELLLTGRIIDAHEAYRIGLVSRLEKAEHVMTAALAIAQEIAAGGPEAIRQLVETLRNPPATLATALEREALYQAVNYSSKEFAEGVLATIEKRTPRFAK